MRRRRFITNIARAGFVGWAGLAGSTSRSALADEEKVRAPRVRMTAAVIGHTGRGDYGHGLDELFRDRPELDLVAVADADAAGLAKAKTRLQAARAYSDYREMLRVEKPTLVSVAPRQADQHHDMVMAVLQSGAHVFCEKPFAPTLREADEMLTESERRGSRIVVAHQMRMAPAVVRLQASLASGLIGDLLEMRAHGKQDARAGGEDMMVLGTHLFDLMRFFAGDPESCSARVRTAGRPITLADARRVKDDIGLVAGDEVEAQFTFPHGVLGTFTSRAALRESVGAWGLEFIGSKGAVCINANIPPAVFVKDTSAWQADGRLEKWRSWPDAPVDPVGADAFARANRRLVDDWLSAITERREAICSGRNGAAAVEMVMAAYQAALTDRSVAFPLTRRSHPLAG